MKNKLLLASALIVFAAGFALAGRSHHTGSESGVENEFFLANGFYDNGLLGFFSSDTLSKEEVEKIVYEDVRYGSGYDKNISVHLHDSNIEGLYKGEVVVSGREFDFHVSENGKKIFMDHRDLKLPGDHELSFSDKNVEEFVKGGAEK